MIRTRSRTVPLVRQFLLKYLNEGTIAPANASVGRFETKFFVSAGMNILRSYQTNADAGDAEAEGFGKLAEKEGVTVFKLPAELRLPKEEGEDEKPKPKWFSRNTPYWYFLQCKRLAKEEKVSECLQFFEEKMLKEDRVFPEESNYTVVIAALGRNGQVKKAFQLYKQMRDRAILPSAHTYTALFNAVAQSPDSKDLRRAVSLYTKLHRGKIRMTRITYNSLIKVFGRHGTMEQMMGVFRESITAGYEPDSQTFNMILLSMLRHTDDGFRYAIEVWRQMMMLDIKPDGKTIMYFLKVMKSCGIGDPEVAHRKLVREMPDPAEYKNFFKKHIRNIYWLKGQKSMPITEKLSQLPPEPEILTLESGSAEGFPETEMPVGKQESDVITSERGENKFVKDHGDSVVHKSVTDVVIDSTISIVPNKNEVMTNLLQLPFIESKTGERSSLVPLEIRRCNLPYDRLKLIGGHKYILEMFEMHEIKPTVMVLSALVEVLPPNARAEDEVIEFAEKHSLKLDADFFNAVLRKRAARNERRSSKEILSKMVTLGLSPNYRTWCVSAITCVHGGVGVSLINEAKKANVDFDNVFFNTLIGAALRNKPTSIEGYKDVSTYDYRYLCRILHEMKAAGVKPSKRTITLLEKASDWPEGYNRWKVADTHFERQVFKFRKQYNDWLATVEMAEDDAPP